jgi:uncharacterized protein (TIGR02246 family)
MIGLPTGWKSYCLADKGSYVNARNLVLLAMLVLPGCAKLPVVQEVDSTAIRALLRAYEAAINRRDVDAAIATYLPDADVWVVGYDRIAGLEAIRQNEERAVGAPGFQAWTTSVDAIRFIGADAALVESSGTVSIGGDRIAERITWVVNRTVAGWRIAAVRVMAFQRSGA